MSLAARLAEDRPTKKCIVARLRDTLPVDELTALDVMLDDPHTWPNATLARLLREEGHLLSGHSIRAHRLLICTCYRRTST